MKKINKILVLSAILAGIFGASFQKNKTVVKTEAAVITNSVKLYLEPGVWDVDSAWFAAYFFGDGDGWYKMEAVGERYKVEFTAEKYYTNVIFARMDKNKLDVLDWDAKWNQTENLVYNGTDNVFAISDWGGEKSPGEWKTVEGLENDSEPPLPPLPTFIQPEEGIKNDKVRIWLDRSGHYGFGYQFSLKIGDNYYLPTAYEDAIFEGRDFAYYDMPLSVLTGGPVVNVVIFQTDIREVLSVSAGPYLVGDNNKIWKIDYVAESWGVTKGAITERILNSFLAKVLEGYLTCSPSVENGYGAYPAIEANFIPKAEGVWNVQDNLNVLNIVDYAGEGTAGYGSDRGEGVSVSAQDKYDALKAMYNNNLPDGSGGDTNISNRLNSTSIAFIVITAAVSLFAGLFFFYKKKFVVR